MQVECIRNGETWRYFKRICAKDQQRNKATVEELREAKKRKQKKFAPTVVKFMKIKQNKFDRNGIMDVARVVKVKQGLCV